MQLNLRYSISALFLVGVGCSPSGGTTVSPVGVNSDNAAPSSGGASANLGGSPNLGSSTTGGATNVATGSGAGVGNTGGTAVVSSTPAVGSSPATGGNGNATGGTRSSTTIAMSSGGINSTSGGSSSIATGGSGTAGGTKSTTTGGAKSTTTGGSSPTGGKAATGGSVAITGGSVATAGGSKATTGSCSFGTVTVSKSTALATVGTVEFTAPAGATNLQVVYTLSNAANGLLNTGGIAPVDTTKANNHTLLLGLKQSSTYTVHAEATLSDGSTCKSSDATLTTGTLSGAPSVTRTVTNASAQAKGFIVTCTGNGGGMGGASTSNSAYILDADGAVVWAAAAPSQCSRAHMDYEGINMWMLSLNVGNSGGEMRFVSMDGLTSKTNISGLSSAHHDFTVLPKKIATMVWASSGQDPESNLVEMASDGSGSTTTVFKIGSNLYSSSTFHANSIHYHPQDDSFTISDRNPNLYVKVSSSGAIQWQLGGSCSGAPAGTSKCVAGSWKVNHGHHYVPDTGRFLVFNNGQSGASHVFEYTLSTSGTMSATLVKDFTSGSTSSNVLGDAQRLTNGNTLITYSTSGQMVEVDSSWTTVQTLKGSFGYADWRETLYGSPPR